nr:hypothetical protein [Acetobacter persici]
MVKRTSSPRRGTRGNSRLATPDRLDTVQNASWELSAIGECLPDGRRLGHEWVCRNPRRGDRKPGSFSVNLNTGRWADFAEADARGGDVISLAAYLAGVTQYEAALELAKMLGLKGGSE